ncbi:MAG: CTP-dependent riboflavin kinase [Crenarchaeota archaeon]|nr:CTP-dependent riboflavin kinase [Thermoproteota archaeon]
MKPLGVLIFCGFVSSGQGNGKKFLELNWVKQQIEEKLGYSVFPGTLNLTLNKESVKQKVLLNKMQALQIIPAKGYCFGFIYKARINEIECAVVVPDVENYPENILEVIAPIYLREALKIKDGNVLAINVLV